MTYIDVRNIERRCGVSNHEHLALIDQQFWLIVHDGIPPDFGLFRPKHCLFYRLGSRI